MTREIPTKELISEYERFLRNAENWQVQADALRDKIAKRVLREGNFLNGSRATRLCGQGNNGASA